MENPNQLKQLLADILEIDTSYFDNDTQLLGNLPEFDSMAVMRVILGLEYTFSISLAEDEVDAELFETFGSLLNFVRYKQETGQKQAS